MDAALAAYRSLLSEIGREDSEPLSAQPRLSYALGARIDVGIEVGQALLESRSESARLVLITEALEQGRHSLRIAAERERRAVRNGKVEPSPARAGRDRNSGNSSRGACRYPGPRLGFNGRTCGRLLGQPAPQARKPTIAGRGSSRTRLEG